MSLPVVGAPGLSVDLYEPYAAEGIQDHCARVGFRLERQMRRVPRNRVLSETGFATPEKAPGKPTTPGQRQTRTVENPTTDLS